MFILYSDPMSHCFEQQNLFIGSQRIDASFKCKQKKLLLSNIYEPLCCRVLVHVFHYNYVLAIKDIKMHLLSFLIILFKNFTMYSLSA